MPGVLPRLDLLPPEDPDVHQQQLATAYQDATTYLETRGIIAGGTIKSPYRGEMPAEITSLDDEQLGDLLNNLSVWCGYLDVELAKADASYREALKALEGLRANIRLRLKVDEEGKRLTGPDKDDRVESEPRVASATRREVYCYAIFRILRGVRDQAQKNWETVSRRITQRGQEISRMRREVNVAGVPVQGRTFVRRRPT